MTPPTPDPGAPTPDPGPRFRALPGQGIGRRLVDAWLMPFRVATSWPGGGRRLLLRVLVVNALDATALFLVARLLPGVEVPTWLDAFLVVLFVSVLSIVVRPAIVQVTRGSALVSFVAALTLNALLFQVAALLSPAFQVGNFLNALLTAFGVGAIHSLASGVLSLDEGDSFYGDVLKRMSRDRGLLDTGTSPGTVILQVDGLAAPVFRYAMRTGVMPYLASWLANGTHRLIDWETDLPSMTSSSQAGILHGNNAGIPAFRWFEKSSGRLMVSNRPEDAAEIERRVSGDRNLLAPNGTSIANLFSGGAARSLLTTSTVRVDRGLILGGRAQDELAGYFVDPYNLGRTLFQVLSTLAVEWYEARRQRLRDVRPRMHRGGIFPVLRAVSSVILRDLTTTYVIEHLQRGVPIVYADLLSYDEIAHHAGPERPEAMRELEAVDRQIRTVVRGASGAPRPYRFVVLSDHGQSLGATFRQRFGEDLDGLIRRLVGAEAKVEAPEGESDTSGRLDSLLRQGGSGSGVRGRVARRLARRVVRSPAAQAVPRDGAEEPDIVVCPSGNLALVYFNRIEGRATLEDLEELHPGLVGQLAAHPGIGFVLVRTASKGAVAVGRNGVHVLRGSRAEGDDPLAPFGPRTLERLRRIDSLDNVGDLVIISLYEPSTDEVAAFEELIGSHGGLGGPQTLAFALVPAEWPAFSKPLVGAEAVNAALRGWIGIGPPVDPGGAGPGRTRSVRRRSARSVGPTGRG